MPSHKISKDYRFIQRFDLHFNVEICKLDSDAIPKVHLSGTLPSLSVFLSVEKFVKILYLMDNAFPPDALPEVMSVTAKVQGFYYYFFCIFFLF